MKTPFSVQGRGREARRIPYPGKGREARSRDHGGHVSVMGGRLALSLREEIEDVVLGYRSR